MKYYIAFDKENLDGNVIAYGVNPENDSGFVSRCSNAVSEQTFDDFASYEARLIECGFDSLTDPLL